MSNDHFETVRKKIQSLNSETREALRISLEAASLKESIYMIESPSPEDLYKNRNEGDALARTLGLADVSVSYYLAVSEETFQQALDEITIKINEDDDLTSMPFIHISAHGHESGLELTDGGSIFWEQLTKKLKDVSQLIGVVPAEIPCFGGLSRLNLGLSSCSAFKNYYEVCAKNMPVQMMLGPNVDVEWCQALIGFTTFYYQSFVLQQAFPEALSAMNIAASGGEQIFSMHSNIDLAMLAGPVFDSLVDHITNQANR